MHNLCISLDLYLLRESFVELNIILPSTPEIAILIVQFRERDTIEKTHIIIISRKMNV